MGLSRDSPLRHPRPARITGRPNALLLAEQRIDGYHGVVSTVDAPTSQSGTSSQKRARLAAPARLPMAVTVSHGDSQIRGAVRRAGRGQEIRPIFTMGNPPISGSISSHRSDCERVFIPGNRAAALTIKRQALRRILERQHRPTLSLPRWIPCRPAAPGPPEAER